MPRATPAALGVPLQPPREDRQSALEGGRVRAGRMFDPDHWPARRCHRQRATDRHPAPWPIVVEEGDADGTG
jgi:hypothetical protein